MENLYSCRKCVIYIFSVLFVVLSTEAENGPYSGPFVVDEGDSFHLECQVSEFDHVKWTVDGMAVPGDSSSTGRLIGAGRVLSELWVPSALPSHSGEYRCSPFIIPGHKLIVRSATTLQIDSESPNHIFFDYRMPLEIKCNSTDSKVTLSWRKDDAEFTTSDVISKGQSPLSTTIRIPYAVDKDAGRYTCVSSDGVTANVTAVLKPFVKLPPNTNVVEGEKLVVTCIVHGWPVPKITWEIDGNRTEAKDRVKILEHKDKEKDANPATVPDGILQIDETIASDRALYTCTGETVVAGRKFNSTSETVVRVKDKMAALWPFLGICLEVVILCTVILIYEKKRNKTEMDESDTDGSPDQKNTPDHGKDSEVRHRK